MSARLGRIAGFAALGAVLVFLIWPGDSLQIRDRPVEIAPGDGPLRILVFGTSLSAGREWPDRAGAALAVCLDREVEVEVLAKPGAGSDWAVEQIEAARGLDWDVAAVEFAINDADWWDGLSLEDAQANHEALVRELSDVGPVILLTMSPAYGLRGLRRVWLGDYYEMTRQVAATMGAGLLDLYPRWLRAPAGTIDFPDGLHPLNVQANAVIVPALTGYLGAALGADCAATFSG